MTKEELDKHMEECKLCNSAPDDPHGVCPIYTEYEKRKDDVSKKIYGC
jgi:hypothetical protein